MKKIIVIIACLLMSLSLFACNKGTQIDENRDLSKPLTYEEVKSINNLDSIFDIVKNASVNVTYYQAGEEVFKENSYADKDNYYAETSDGSWFFMKDKVSAGLVKNDSIPYKVLFAEGEEGYDAWFNYYANSVVSGYLSIGEVSATECADECTVFTIDANTDLMMKLQEQYGIPLEITGIKYVITVDNKTCLYTGAEMFLKQLDGSEDLFMKAVYKYNVDDLKLDDDKLKIAEGTDRTVTLKNVKNNTENKVQTAKGVYVRFAFVDEAEDAKHNIYEDEGCTKVIESLYSLTNDSDETIYTN